MRAPKLYLNQRQADEFTAVFPHLVDSVVVMKPIREADLAWVKSINSSLPLLENLPENPANPFLSNEACLTLKRQVSSEA